MDSSPPRDNATDATATDAPATASAKRRVCRACGVLLAPDVRCNVLYCPKCKEEVHRKNTSKRNRRRGMAAHARGYKRVSARDLAAEVAANRDAYPEDVQRPRTRAECVDGPRPCPYVSCRHHLFLEAAGNGTLLFQHWGREPDEIPKTCSLDVTPDGMQIEQIAEIMGMSRESVRQIEIAAMAKIRAAVPYLRDDVAGDRVRLVVLPSDDEDDEEMDNGFDAADDDEETGARSTPTR